MKMRQFKPNEGIKGNLFWIHERIFLNVIDKEQFIPETQNGWIQTIIFWMHERIILNDIDKGQYILHTQLIFITYNY